MLWLSQAKLVVGKMAMRPIGGLLLTFLACGASLDAGAHPRRMPRPIVVAANVAPRAPAYAALMDAPFAQPSAPSMRFERPFALRSVAPLGALAVRRSLITSPATSAQRQYLVAQRPMFKPPPAFSLPAQNFTLAGRGPAALTASSKGYVLDFAPQAGLDWSDARSSAQAGGMLRLALHRPDDRPRPWLSFGAGQAPSVSESDRGRWFLFAAASGQVIGFNVNQSTLGGPSRSLWATPGADTLVSDAQSGLGWRKGAMLASVGYVHREVHYDNGADPFGPQTVRDSMVGVSFSLHP